MLGPQSVILVHSMGWIVLKFVGEQGFVFNGRL
jgi:hypothetical protein